MKKEESKPKTDYKAALLEVLKMIKTGKHPETIIKYIESVL